MVAQLIMNSKIHQLCQNIAKHPSLINNLSQAIALAIEEQSVESFRLILELVSELKKEEKVGDFLDKKNLVIFAALLNLEEGDQQTEKKAVLEKCYEVSRQSEKMAEAFWQWAQEQQSPWDKKWPNNLLIGVFGDISRRIEKQEFQEWALVTDMILNLPALSEMEVSTDQEPPFKKSFQKVVVSVVASQNCPFEVLQQLYHGIGIKVLAKMSQPLALANHCLSRFAQNPEIQIEVLSLLFLLVGKYGLELEQFYPKLEKLIRYKTKKHSIYELPNSRRFFKLVEASLRSSRVPFRTVSSFAHILIRQLPQQTGEFAFWALSFIVNLTKKHRKLLDELPLIPEIQALKHHYNSKVRALVGELFKNLNKADYLQIQDFTKVNMAAMTQKKLKSALSSLENDELEFKVPVFEEPL